MENADRFALTCSREDSENTTRMMNELRIRKQLCDVALIVEDERFDAHRVVLAAHSPYFLAMFTGGMAEKEQGEISIHGCESDTMRQILDYFYTRRLEITSDNAQSLLAAAGMLQLSDVLSACAEFISTQLDPSNCLAARALGDAYGCETLWKAAETYALQHFDVVVASDDFASLPFELVTELLSRDSLCVQREEQVFEAAMRWLQHDPSSRRVKVVDVLRSVRLEHVNVDYLVDCIETNDLVRESVQFRELVNKAKNYHLLPDRRSGQSEQTARPSTLGLVYVVGGMNDSEQALGCVERLQLGQEGCGKLADDRLPPEAGRLQIARSGLAIAQLGNFLYAVGGHSSVEHGYLASVERYTPGTDEWTFVTPLNNTRRYVGVAALDGKLYAVGGSSQQVQDSVECYCPVTNCWTQRAAMLTARRHAGVAVMNGYLYAVGGHDGSEYLKSAERYDATKDEWATVAPMSCRRGGLAAAALGGRLYAVGGYNGYKNVNTVERYDAATNAWTMVAPMKLCRSGLAIAVAGRRLLAVGGHNGTKYLSASEWFDPRLGVWESGPDFKTERAVAGVAVLTGSDWAVATRRATDERPATSEKRETTSVDT